MVIKKRGCTTISANEKFSRIKKNKTEKWLRVNKLSRSDSQLKRWIQMAKYLISRCEELGVDYVVIKCLNIPNAYMTDVDLLMRSQVEALTLLEDLKSNGFKIWSRKYDSPWKYSAVSPTIPIDLDLYLTTSYIGMKYANKEVVFNNAERTALYKIECNALNPYMDVYVIATHAYSHGMITLGELIHVVKNLRNADDIGTWRKIIKSTTSFGLQHSLAIIFELASRFMDQEAITLRRLLEEDPSINTRIFLAWLGGIKNINFPLLIPWKLRLLSAITKTIKPGRNLEVSFGETASYFLRIGRLLNNKSWEHRR